MFDRSKILDTLMKGNGLYGDVFEEKKIYTHIHLESERIEKLERGIDHGVGLRLINPWKTYFGSTNNLEENNILEIADGLSRFSREKSVKQKTIESRIDASYPFTINLDPETVAIEKKVAMLKKLESSAKSMEPRIRQARIIYRDTRQIVRLFSSAGKDLSDNRIQVVLNLLLVGEENGEMQTSYEAIGGFYGYDFFSEETIETLVAKTVKRLAGLLSAREAPMGTKTVVLSSEAGGTMVHEAIGHGLEADLALEGISCYKGMLGEQIASPLINIVDDATIPHLRGTYAYDDEGIHAERTALVESGILKNLLFDKFYAMKYDKISTGNGRRESYRYKPIPRMSNTLILSGHDDPASIIASVDDGVFVVKMGGGQVDTVRGDFVFEISEGYLIKRVK